MTVKEFVELVSARPDLLERKLAHASDSGHGDQIVYQVYVGHKGFVACSGGGYPMGVVEILK